MAQSEDKPLSAIIEMIRCYCLSQSVLLESVQYCYEIVCHGCQTDVLREITRSCYEDRLREIRKKITQSLGSGVCLDMK